MPYDYEHEAQGCVNELYYRNGPQAQDIECADVNYVQETIERYLREAYEAGKKAAASAHVR